MNKHSAKELALFGVMVISTLILTIIYDSLPAENSWKFFARVFGVLGTSSSMLLIIKMTPLLQKKVKHYSLAVWFITVGIGLMSLSYLCNGVFSTAVYSNLLIGFITLILGFLLMAYSIVTNTFGETA